MTQTVIFIISLLTCFITGLVFGTTVPVLLLWHKTQECRYLLNMVTRQQKLPAMKETLMSGILGTVKPEDKTPIVQPLRRSIPTPIDLFMQEAIEADTAEHLGTGSEVN